MQNNSNVQTIEQITEGKQLLAIMKIGETNVLAEMLGITPAAARARLLRNSNDAIEAAKAIIANRNRLIEEYQSKI